MGFKGQGNHISIFFSQIKWFLEFCCEKHEVVSSSDFNLNFQTLFYRKCLTFLIDIENSSI